MLLMPLLLTGCVKGEFSNDPGASPAGTCEVRLSFRDASSADIGDDAWTRASSDTIPFSRIDVAFVPLERHEGDSVYSFHLDASGEASVRLPTGRYHLVAVASNASSPVSIASEREVRFPGDVIGDMAYSCDAVELQPGGGAVTCGLRRGVAAFRLYDTATRDMSVTDISFEMDGNCGTVFDATTGTANPSGEEVYVRKMSYPTDGRKITHYNVYLFLGSKRETFKVTVRMYYTDGKAAGTLHFDDVVLERGKRTVYRGAVFSEDNTLGFTMEDPVEFPIAGTVDF